MEDVGHLVMRCTYVEEEREKLKELMNERVEGRQGMDDNVRVTVVMNRAYVEMRLLEGQWRECGRGVTRHMHDGHRPSTYIDLKTLMYG